MLTHVVLFKVAEPVAENAEAVAARLRGMAGRVAGLDTITVGLDVDRGPRAWDVCLMTTHADREALATYQADALHGEVKAFLAEHTTGAALVDFET